MSKRLIIFTDSGDTLVDEGTQKFDEKGIVTEAELIPGADNLLKTLHKDGFRIALVADGEVESFDNVYRDNGLGYCFEKRIISEAVGIQKPAKEMFDTAMKEMNLTDEDKSRIIMIGNNLKKDIAGANRFGIISVWLDWSPRYFHEIEEPDWQPDYIVKTPEELLELIYNLEDKLCSGMSLQKNEAERKLKLIADAFKDILYEEDEKFLENMKTNNLAGDDIRKYQYWEWTQGVGLFGFWKMFMRTENEEYLNILKDYYDRQLTIGFPALNVNTVTPYLAMSYLAEYTSEEKYMKPCIQAAYDIMHSFPRTEEGGFQHMTSDTLNEQELWDDTLYMTVLFLANMGRILDNEEMKAEVMHQFKIHIKYLSDKDTGLWYHGWTFKDKNNFAGAFWARGNCWVTMAIPEFLAMYEGYECDCETKKLLTDTLNRQVESLKKYQAPSGMWHTLIDDETSYVEASGTCGFAYGILKGIKLGILDKEYESVALKALKPILGCISDGGVVHQVSYGTPMGRITRDFYKNIELKPMPYGQALAMLFLMEYLG